LGVQLRFWGVRGSVPWATPSAIGHGCNTPCLQITDERSGAILMIDAGSGIVGTSQALTGPPREIALLLTHYHWDHLQGLPFFHPLYEPGWEPTIYAPELGSHDPRWLSTVFKSPFFPVPYDQLPNRPAMQMIDPGQLRIGPFEVTALKLNHPGGAFAYRIRGTLGDVVFATDHEFGDPAYDEPLADFVRDAAALILDAHFTPNEMPQHRGWGHSDWRTCATFAAAHNVGGLYLFHHKPGRSDQDLVRIRTDARRIFPASETASEGDAFQL
jgi:phosphoribosyl 1,2-cyclic phosphodiesterase